MKMAPLLGSSALVVSLFSAPSLNAQSSPSALAQPAVNANAQNQANVNAEATRDPRFTSRYGSARPAASAAAPAAAPAAAARPVAVPAAVPVAVAPPVQAPADDPRFTSRYGSARPRAAQPAPAAAPVAARPAPGAPGAVAVPAAQPAAPVRAADPDREQRIINFQRQNAASGNPSAQYDLGMRYLRGNGLEQDDTQAMEWLKLAAQNGDSRAKKELAALQARAATTPAPDAAAPAKAPETK